MRTVYTDIDGQEGGEDISDKENDDAREATRGEDQEVEEDVEMEVEEQLQEEFEDEKLEVLEPENEEHTEHEVEAEYDEEVELEPEARTARPRATVIPETPRMDDLRHIFNVPRTDATPSFNGVHNMFKQPAPPSVLETPHLEGIRPMFTRAERAAAESSKSGGDVSELYQRVMATPTLEGIGEMLNTPAGYRREDAPQQELESHDELGAAHEDDADDEPLPAPKTRSKKPLSKSKTASARRTSPRTQPAPEPAEFDEMPAIDEESASTVEPAPASRVTRKTRGKAADSDMEHSEAESSQPRTRRTRKGTVSPAPEQSAAVPRSSRRARTKTPTPTPEDAPATATRSSARRRAKTPIVEEDEDDPIDSIDRAVSPEVPLLEPPAPADSKVRRSTRAKLTMEIKEEEADDSPTVPAKASASSAQPAKSQAQRSGVPRPVRGRKPATTTTSASTLPRASSIPRGATTTARGSRTTLGLRRPTSAALAKQAESVIAPNKENTPEPDDDIAQPTAAKTTSRVSKAPIRPIGRTRATAGGETAEIGKSRVSRSKSVRK